MASSFARSAGDFSDGYGGTPAAWPAPSTVGGGEPPALSLLLCLLVDAPLVARWALPPLSSAGLKPLPAGTQGVFTAARPTPIGRPHTIPRPGASMTTDALALVAVALAKASPGGVPGSQVPALLQAASALAGPSASSSSLLGPQQRPHRSRAPSYHPPSGRASACLRPRRQQRFQRTQRQAVRPPPPTLSVPSAADSIGAVSFACGGPAAGPRPSACCRAGAGMAEGENELPQAAAAVSTAAQASPTAAAVTPAAGIVSIVSLQPHHCQQPQSQSQWQQQPLTSAHGPPPLHLPPPSPKQQPQPQLS
ncbi:unnamed protein product [Closterium sp. NIES-64]|nr:unnamed protein product [Closterium sp. NIES-64]